MTDQYTDNNDLMDLSGMISELVGVDLRLRGAPNWSKGPLDSRLLLIRNAAIVVADRSRPPFRKKIWDRGLIGSSVTSLSLSFWVVWRRFLAMPSLSFLQDCVGFGGLHQAEWPEVGAS